MPDKALQFPKETYRYDNGLSVNDPFCMDGSEVGFLTTRVCLPNEDGEFRRYRVISDNEGFIYAHHGGTNHYYLGAIACPKVFKCTECPLKN